jgi:hypothetical protein
MNYIRASFTCFSDKIILPTIPNVCLFLYVHIRKKFFAIHFLMYLDIEVGQCIISGILRVEILHPEKYFKNYIQYRIQHKCLCNFFLFLIPV